MLFASLPRDVDLMKIEQAIVEFFHVRFQLFLVQHPPLVIQLALLPKVMNDGLRSSLRLDHLNCLRVRRFQLRDVTLRGVPRLLQLIEDLVHGLL